MVDTAESTPEVPASGVAAALEKILKHLEDVEEILEDIEGRLSDIETTSYGTRGYKDEDD